MVLQIKDYKILGMMYHPVEDEYSVSTTRAWVSKEAGVDKAASLRDRVKDI